MARTRLTARKSTGGRAPRGPLARRCSKFLEEFGMTTILWRILYAAGYPEGNEPRYRWLKDSRSDTTSVRVTASVVSLDNYSN